MLRQQGLPPFEAVCSCRVRAIDVPPETLVQRLRAMHSAGRMEIDLFAQDNMRLQELLDTGLASPFLPEEEQVEAAIYPSLMAGGVIRSARYFLPFRPNVQIAYYYLYQGNWFDTAIAATLMTLPVLVLSAFLQRYLRETNLAGAIALG